MQGSNVHHHRSATQRWVVRAIIAGVASWYAWHVLVHGGDRPMFEAFLRPVTPYPYPTASVALTIGAIAVEVLVVDLLLNYRAERELWRRAIIGALLLAPVSALSPRALMDAPPYHGLHLLWLLSLNLILLGLAALSGAAHLARVTFEQR